MNNDLLALAIDRTVLSSIVFAKFLSPNDTGLTGGHQCGIYIPKSSVPLIFDELFEKGTNRDRKAEILWNEESSTKSRFIYYGQGTRNEYRITKFGRGFTLLKPDHTGDLLVICKENDEKYYAYVLSDDDSIQGFLDAFSISPTEVNCLIKNEAAKDGEGSKDPFTVYIKAFGTDFPDTQTMARSAQEIEAILRGEDVCLTADETIIRWIDAEYKLFRRIEEVHYEFLLLEPTESLEAFVKIGLEITNRRKSRAGKSLEHHLKAIFNDRCIKFKEQAVTELNKRPDFIFPSEEAYHDPEFPAERLTFLGAKTTCKDRWRQVINEADRIEEKYLFTLQQGVSPNQLKEMHEHHLTLVVPEPYHKDYPRTDFVGVITFEEFLSIVLEKQGF
ncbi:type II restriction endonuclease [Raoultibacter phocaeensis]|uniref:type II restriction endonuclease n=1 Tax=Raoultibacter phocaeensis TaxID=2479841 RepID=UPI0015D61810|nr:type II restriction endonuclease [Raoultibacter phocaeensis]